MDVISRPSVTWRVYARSLSCVAVAAALAALASCSSTALCDDANCNPGNQCIAFNSEIKCRKTCSSNADPATSCPFGYTCTDAQQGASAFCVQDEARRADGKPLEKKTSGQWGATCQANLGVENPGCNLDQGFYCYGTAPTDANAYCTRYDCSKDSQCGPGFWCGTINVTPNVQTAKRSTIGEVQRVCLRRTFCATCKVDLDCPPIKGVPQHCFADGGGAPFCAPECQDSSNCPNEAKCVDAGLSAKICYPRADVCVGNGSLCAPCRVDTDCGTDGACLKGDYTTERACGKKAPGACSTCPRTVDSPKRSIGCSATGSNNLPKEYCVGLYAIGGDPSDLGCWTPDR